MKAYGHKRKNMMRCKYGCCGYKGLKEKNGSEHVDRAARKSSRQEGERGIFRALIEQDKSNFEDVLERD